MRRFLRLAVALSLASAAALLAPTRTAGQGASRFERDTFNGRDVVAREVLVKFRQAPSGQEIAQLRVERDAADVHPIGHAGVFHLRSRTQTVAALLAALSRRSDVLYAEPNFIVHLTSEPNDPRYPELWGLHNIGQVIGGLPGVSGADIHAVPAWNISLGSTANVVAVIDTGIDYTHPDLVANMWSAPSAFTVNIDGAPVTCAAGTHGFNAITRSCDPMDDEDHGTHVSGTVGATGDNGTGVVGVNWTTRLMAIRFIDATGNGTTADAISSVEFAIAVKQRFASTNAANIRVLSNSWGGPEFSQALEDEVSAANDADMLFVAGAGNDGSDNDGTPFYPASFNLPNVISVAATDNNDELAWFSNYGPSSVDLGAPGVDILSTIIGNQYEYLSGTSMATPHVSGAAALVLSQCAFDTATLKDAILGTVDPLPTLEGLTATGGRLNVYSALYSCIAPPAVPTHLTARGGNALVTLSWDPILGATRYNVKRSLTPGGPYTSVNAAVRGTTYADTSVTNDTTYYYVVSAGNSVGDSADSNEASATPRIPSDLVVSSFTVPSAAASGATITVSLTIQNQGAGLADASTTRFYWSANSILDPSDSAIAEQPLGQLAAGASASTSLTIALPSTSAGNHYLIVQADANDVLSESSETNNTLARLIQIGPDLTISALTVPGNGGADATIVINDTTKNQGGAAAAASTTKFYFSTNVLLDGTDTLLGGRTVGALDPAAMSSGSTTVTIPSGTPPGTYYVIAKADGDGVVDEISEANNVISRPILIGSDLLVTALTVPTKSGAGSTITVTDTTSNLGGGTAGASVTRFYLSANNTIDPSDTVLPASHSVPDLAPNAAHTASTVVTLPAVPAGIYYIIAKADDDNAVVELRETNNTLLRSIAIGPDLVVSSFTVPTVGGAGSSLTVSDTTTNQGGGSATPTTTKFFLSSDGLWDATDPVLGSRDIAALDPSDSNSGTTSITIPAGTAPGSYYIIAKADADSVMPESSEINNVLARSITIGPDLVVSALTVPTKGGAGGVISVTDTTANQGGGTATSSVTRFYLSTNSAFDAGDTLLDGNHAVPGLIAGATHSAATTLTLPAVATGNYYIIARADDSNAVSESRETNNALARSIAIGSDLIVSALSAPALGGAGVTITVSDTTLNQGGGAVGATSTKFYLSTNSVFDTSDPLLGGRPVPALNAGAGDTASTTLTIPVGTPSGTYYLIARADADDAISETTESNNTIARAIQIGSDLAVSAISAPARAGAGTAIVITDTTTNQGGGDAPATLTAFYLATSSTPGPSDVLLDSNRSVPPLAAGTSSSGTTTVTIPAGTAPGNFFLIARADVGNAVVETLETNNTRTRSISIGPDLTFSALSLSPTTVAAGGTLTISDTVINQGGGAAGPSTTRFYLSINSVLDSTDVLLTAARAVPALAAGASSAGSTLVTIPTDTVAGTYYVIAKADADAVVAESAENNNAAVVRAIQVSP